MEAEKMIQWLSYICDFCFSVAFEYDHLPEPNERILSENARLRDGTKPTKGEEIVCQQCKQFLPNPFRIENFKPF